MKKIIKCLSYIAAIFIIFTTYSCKEKKNNTADEEMAIKNIYKEFSNAIAAKDMKKVMSFYVPGNELVAFDAFIPRQYKGAAAYQKAYDGFFVAFPGPANSIITDINVKVAGDLAYASCIDEWNVTGADKKTIDMIFRATNVFEKRNGKWLIIHEHLSFPADPNTGLAEYLSK